MIHLMVAIISLKFTLIEEYIEINEMNKRTHLGLILYFKQQHFIVILA